MKMLYFVAGVLCFVMGYSRKCECASLKKCLCKKSYSLVEVKGISSVNKEVSVQNFIPKEEAQEEKVEEQMVNDQPEEQPKQNEEVVAMIQTKENSFLKRPIARR